MTRVRVRSHVLSLLVTAALVGAFASPRDAHAREGAGGDFGLGLVLGTPTGLTANLYLTNRTALDFGLGLDAIDDDDDFFFHVTYKVIPVVLARGRSLSVPLYLGVGGFLSDHDRAFGDASDLGLRVPLGIDLDFRRAPFQIFLEINFNFYLITIDHDHGDTLDLGGAVGFRVYC